MKANAPDKIYACFGVFGLIQATEIRATSKDIEYIRKDAFIDKACGWIKENITNNPNANSVLVRNGCVTLGMLIDDFINYMKEE